MNIDRAITYSLLAHIRNSGTLVKGPLDIFIPLVKRALSIMNNEGVFKGKSILEIKSFTDKLYSIDFPVPVLNKILDEICREINTQEVTYFALYKDGAFSINQYSFDDYESVIKTQEEEAKELEELFASFCKTAGLSHGNKDSIFLFIEKSKYALSKYISNRQSPNGEDFTDEARFIEFFKKIPPVYDRIKNIYLGSIISGYLEYNPENISLDIELLLDTNFLLGLLDLNTPESTHTCGTLLEIAKKQGFKITVLKDTIEETKSLLEAKANNFDRSFLHKKVNPEDVYNACERRNLSRSDLERIADNLDNKIHELKISLVANTDKLAGEAKFTEEYKLFESFRNTKKSALHDAMAILYVKKKRGNRIKEFEKVNAWFVNNSIEGSNIIFKDGFLPETIKADDLLNIMWLSNPQVSNHVEGEDLAKIGLTSIISLTLNKGLPKSQILRELDDNIHKYASEELSDSDIVRVATRITNKQLLDIEELNELAEKDKIAFVKRLEEEAKEQKRIEDETYEKLEKLFTDLMEKSEAVDDLKRRIKKGQVKKDKQAEEKLRESENRTREVLREQWYKKQVNRWRRKTWIEFLIGLFLFIGAIIYLFAICSWDLTTVSENYKAIKSNFILSLGLNLAVLIFTGITIKTLYDKYRNHSNIVNYKKDLIVPEELKELP